MLINDQGAFIEQGNNVWVQVIPLPYYGRDWLFRNTFRCECGEKFRSEEQYGIHYEFTHISDKRYHRTPQGLVEINEEGEKTDG